MKTGKRKKWIVLVLVFVIIMVGIFIAIKEYRKEKETFKMIFIPKIVDETNDFWTSLLDGVDMATTEFDIDMTIVAPTSEEDYERQNELIEWAITQNPDAILICPCNYTKTTGAAKKVVEAGIHLILIDSVVDEEIQEAIIATDNIEAGTKVGKYMKKYVEEDTEIAIVGHVKGTSTAIEREYGIREGLEEASERIVDVVFCDSSSVKAYTLTVELMKKHPNITLIGGLNEYSAVGAAKAIRDLGLGDAVTVVGFDSSTEEIRLLESGIFEGFVIQKPFNMGYLGVQQALKIVRGEEYEPYLDSGSELITRENIYTEENQKLLFPFRGGK